MVLNNFKKSTLKILIDIEDLKNFNIPVGNLLCNPCENIIKILKNFSEYKNIDIKSLKQFNIYSFKFITFYITIQF